MSSKAIFISHAVANKEIADKLVDLIETGIGIPDSEIFCSSLEGLGIPSGFNFIDFIKKEISEPKAVMLILTPEYLKSIFCLCELGASWVLSHNVFPLLVPPLEYSEVKAVLTGIHELKIDQKSDLNEMREELTSALGIPGKSYSRWESNRDKFLKRLKRYLDSYTPAKIISQKKYEKVEKDYKDALEEIKVMDEKLDQKDALIEKLEQIKDKEAVKEIIYESMDSRDKFSELIGEAKERLSPLPYIVCEALYYYFRDECLTWPKYINDDDTEYIKSAIEEDYLFDNGEEIELVEDDPKISDAMDSLRELSVFVWQTKEAESSGDGESFSQYYKETYGHRLNFSSRRFWDEHLL